jgi:RNA polymerase sigma factor (sigma-70 family)
VAVASRVIPLPVPRAGHGLSDRLLVARVASGDDQAFEEILERYGPALLSFCAHMLGSREWGEDALQLTFVAAYKALRRGQCDGALRPWLYAIARNRCLSELRARREIPDSDRVSADRPTIDDPASLFARREQLREIVEDIQRLPTDQRAALVLFELGDHSHEEIATVLGVRRDKVKALIFQAREGLYRGRSARESACSDIRELLANARGNPPARGLVRAHVDRCAPCQEFEREVRRQRAALALVLPVALSGNLKALVLSSAVSHSSVAAGGAAVTGAGGAGSVAGATAAGSGSATLAGSGLGASAAATATGSGSAVGGGAVAAAGSGAVAAAAGTAAPTMIASTLGTDAVAGVGALTSSISAATVAKLATVVAVAVGVGGVTGSALTPSPRPQVSLLAGQPAQPAPLRSPLQPLGSGIADPLASPTDPGSQPGAGATAPAGTPPADAASVPVPSSIAAPSSSAANPAAVSDPTPPTGTTSAPATSAPGDGSATTTASPSASSTTTATTTTTTSSSPTGSGRSTSTTTTASSPTTTAGSSSGSSAGQGPAGGSAGASGNGPGDGSAQGQSSGGNPAGGVTHSNGNGPPVTPPGCVNNPAPGCAKKAPRS